MSVTRPKIFAYANFNLDALLSIATRLRGRPCSADPSTRPKTGSLNWVIFITFDDGTEWAFRSPRHGPSAILTEESASKLLVSEASTLKYLRANSSVPVPEVYSFRLAQTTPSYVIKYNLGTFVNSSKSGSCDNEIGVPYILMGKANGRPLSEFDWVKLSRITGYPNRRPLLPLTDADREKVMKQLGVMMSSLSNFHFDRIGSLFQDSDGNYLVGECLNPALIWQYRDELEGIDRGPFQQESQYFQSLISVFIAHAKELPLSPHSFFAPIPDPFEYPHWTSYRQAAERWRTFCSIGDKVEGNQNRLDFCIAGQFLLKMIPHLTSTNGDFVLSHPDLHTGNIFVDEDFHITSIIDWGSASSGPAAELLATPGLNGSLSPPNELLVAAYRSGFCQGGQKVEPERWRESEKMWHFVRLVRLLSIQDYTHFRMLHDMVYEKKSEDIPRLFREQSTQASNKALLADLYQDESEEGCIKAEENEGGGQGNHTNELAIARKLGMMSEMNPNFLADKRLWLWIEKALEPVKFE